MGWLRVDGICEEWKRYLGGLFMIQKYNPLKLNILLHYYKLVNFFLIEKNILSKYLFIFHYIGIITYNKLYK